MGQNGFLPQDLFLLRKYWDDSGVLVEDSYGQEWVRNISTYVCMCHYCADCYIYALFLYLALH